VALLGDIFLNLLMMLVVPLVIFSMIVGITHARRQPRGRDGGAGPAVPGGGESQNRRGFSWR
jgi:Na+/H+-dicarboxylate symporter